MRRLCMAAVLTLIGCVCTLIAAPQTTQPATQKAAEKLGFSSYKFGSAYKEVMQDLKDSQEMKFDLMTDKFMYYHSEKTPGLKASFMDPPRMIVLENYSIGDKPCKVTLLFTSDGKFYRFKIQPGERVSANKIETSVTLDVRFLKGIFDLKYGRSGDAKALGSADLREGKEFRAVEWENPSNDIFVGVYEREALFWAEGVVTDRAMFRAELERFAAEEKAKAKKGAKDF